MAPRPRRRGAHHRLGRAMVEAAQRRDRANELFDEAGRLLHDALGLPALPAEGAPARTVRASALADRFEASYHADRPAQAEAALAAAGVETTPLGKVAEVRAVTKFRKRVYVERGSIPMLKQQAAFPGGPRDRQGAGERGAHERPPGD